MSSDKPSLAGYRVASFESRSSVEMARMIERYEGQPFVSPSLREVPIDPNRAAIEFAYRVITGEVGVVIF